MPIVTMKDVGKSDYKSCCLVGPKNKRIKHILFRLQRRKSIYAAFCKALLTTPVLNYLNTLPKKLQGFNPAGGQVVRFVRYNKE